MAEIVNIFPSYASSDRDIVWSVLAGLRRAGANIWDYTRPGEGAPLGSTLNDHLRDQIHSADVFLAWATESSFQNALTQFEVTCACERLHQPANPYRVVPIVDSPNLSFVGAYEELAKMFYLIVERSHNSQLEGTVRRLCAELSIVYIPPPVGPRTVYAERFLSELHEKVANEHLAISVAQRIELQEMVAFFNCRLNERQPDWSAILESIMAFRHKVRRENLGSWYYPLVMQGLSYLELTDVSSAERSLNEAVDHPRADEHAFSLLGYVRYRQGRNKEAVYHLTEALRRCRTTPWELKIDMLAVLHAAGSPIEVEEAIRGVDLSPLLVEDWVKVMNLRGIAFYDQGAYQSAENVLQQVWARSVNGRSVGDDLTAIYLAETLIKLGHSKKAIKILEAGAQSFQDGNLYHHLAKLLYDQGRVSEAFQTFEILRRPQLRRRIYGIAYGRRLFREGRHSLMRDVCYDIISPDIYGIPRTPEDFWYCGFAQFLLGRPDLAEYDRIRGIGYSTMQYQDLV